MSEFEQFRTNGFTHGGAVFRVPGDASSVQNNCLFDSVLASGLVPECSPSEFRAIVIKRHLTGQPGRETANKLYPLFALGTETIDDYQKTM
ncbi:hypothetical protein, partial [Bacillus sp. SRB_331]|uniref:hypothetical protein n=1 Tax=Bacillus sp. SRB_331 TaxID=1969379 RepID=UPI00115ABFE6